MGKFIRGKKRKITDDKAGRAQREDAKHLIEFGEAHPLNDKKGKFYPPTRKKLFDSLVLPFI